ncbi:MAG: YlbF family regulator [Bacilli bacterium]|nr:YlbF family regulator [Bacilli bacterium]
MSSAIDYAIAIQEKINELPEAKEYLRLKKIIDNDKEIQDLQKTILEYQRNGENKLADECMSRLNSLPIIVNFRMVEEQLAESLKLISDILK